MSFLKNNDNTSITDIELIHQYKRTGDLQHLGELYQRYMELVYGVCLKYFRDPEEAKDAVMQLFEELAVKLKKHEVENFRGWLHRVAKNHCLMKLRSPRNLKTIDIDPSLVQNEDNVHLNGALEKEENFVKMEKCLDSLTTEQQQMIRLFYLEGKCYNDIVQETGLAWNHVRSHIQNGRRNLKICMEAGETLTPTKKNV